MHVQPSNPSPYSWLLTKARQTAPLQDRLSPCYSTQEVAALLHMHQTTIRRMLVKGTLRGNRLNAKGRYRIPESEVRRLIELKEQSL
jgi:excisionase family DNA binding protein